MENIAQYQHIIDKLNNKMVFCLFEDGMKCYFQVEKELIIISKVTSMVFYHFYYLNFPKLPLTNLNNCSKDGQQFAFYTHIIFSECKIPMKFEECLEILGIIA